MKLTFKETNVIHEALKSYATDAARDLKWHEEYKQCIDIDPNTDPEILTLRDNLGFLHKLIARIESTEC